MIILIDGRRGEKEEKIIPFLTIYYNTIKYVLYTNVESKLFWLFLFKKYDFGTQIMNQNKIKKQRTQNCALWIFIWNANST